MKGSLPLLIPVALVVVAYILFSGFVLPKDLDVTREEQYVSSVLVKGEERAPRKYSSARSQKVIYVSNGSEEAYKFAVSEEKWDSLKIGDKVNLTIQYVGDTLYDVQYEGISCRNLIELRDNPAVQKSEGY